MKKWILGLLVMLMIFPGSALAANTNLIDKEAFLLEDTVVNPPNPPAINAASRQLPSKIPRGFFEGIEFNEEIPTVFTKNEILVFTGKTKEKSGTIRIFLTYEDAQKKSYFINVITKIKNGEFQASFHFEKTGKYFFGATTKEKGDVSVTEVHVKEIEEKEAALHVQAQKTGKIRLEYVDGETRLSWKNTTETSTPLRKITFIQKNTKSSKRERIYYVKHKITSIVLAKKDFKNFKEGIIKIEIEGIGTKQFEITRALKEKNQDEEITYEGIPEKLEKPEPIKVNGVTKTEIEETAVIKTPSGKVEEIIINSTQKSNYFKIKTIPKGVPYSFTYTPKTEGTYQIEVNDKGGSAVINTPVYIGKKIPLLPDYFEIYEDAEYPDIRVEKEKFAQKMLKDINQIRRNYAIPQVKIDTELNLLAQLHAEDMAKNGYLGHVNQQNETPEDRRKKLKITTGVGENIAESLSLRHALEGLLASPGHRGNIMDEKWTRVGLGFALSKNNALITVQEFSTDKMTPENVQKIEQKILQKIQEERAKNGIPEIKINEKVQEITEIWSQKLTEMEKIAFESPDGMSLNQLTQEKRVNRELSLYIFGSNSAENIEEYVLKNAKVTEKEWNEIGFSIKITSIGDLKFTLILVK
ncbi:MAG: CAP domain-containing protein [Patescibacteria group bacterium]